MKLFVVMIFAGVAGCVTEAQHVHPTVLPDGKSGYVIVCNSQRYDRCLSRAARACSGAYTIIPQDRSTIRFGDKMQEIGNSESVLVSCGS
jgi:hypothetical protein